MVQNTVRETCGCLPSHGAQAKNLKFERNPHMIYWISSLRRGRILQDEIQCLVITARNTFCT